MTKYVVDAQGKYRGGFDGAPLPVGAIEVPFAPEHAEDRWTGSTYDKSTRPVPPDASDLANVQKAISATVMLTRKYANELKAGTYMTKAPAETADDFKAIMRALP